MVLCQSRRLACALAHIDTVHAYGPKPYFGSGAGWRQYREAAGHLNYTSNNWSGYQISNTAQYTQAGWTIPTVALPRPGYASDGKYYSTTWTGIGGGFGTSGYDPLIQAGSEQDAFSGGNRIYYFWYAIVGGDADTNGEVQISPPVAHPGDSAGSVAIWTPTQPGSSLGVVQLGVCDFTAGGCVSLYIGADNDPLNRPYTPQPGDSTEWIVEAPTLRIAGANYVTPLANFGYEPFTAAVWTDNYDPSGGKYGLHHCGRATTDLDLARPERFRLSAIPCRSEHVEQRRCRLYRRLLSTDQRKLVRCSGFGKSVASRSGRERCVAQ